MHLFAIEFLLENLGGIEVALGLRVLGDIAEGWVGDVEGLLWVGFWTKL